MARTRNIKPGFFKNDLLAECDPLARILFAGLWTIADRNGRLEYRPRIIKAECLPYDDCSTDVLVAQLEQRGFVRLYECDGRRYLEIPTFGAHQNPHPNEKSSDIPANPRKIASTNLLATEYSLTCNLALGPSPNHLVPSSSNPSLNHTDTEQAPVDGVSPVEAEAYADAMEALEATDLQPLEQPPAKAPRKPRVAFTVCDVEFPPELDTLECRDAAQLWLEHKRERGESYKSAKSFAMKLGELARAGPDAFVAAVKSSIGNNYAGIHPPKETYSGNRNQRPARKPDPGLEFVE